MIDRLLYAPLSIFIQWPLAALIPAGLFAAAYAWRRRTFIAVTAALWGGYAIYELLIQKRVLCSGECNIRVDLLLAYPILWIASLVAIVLLFWRRRGAA
jgi:hypothetical protein